MRYCFVILFLVFSVTAGAQSKKMREAMSNAARLEIAVFGTKDRAVLDELFASSVVYVGFDGKAASKEEAILAVVNNGSIYTKENSPSPYGVNEVADSMIIKHVYSATEKKADGTESLIKYSVESIWAKENGKLKLFRSKITSL